MKGVSPLFFTAMAIDGVCVGAIFIAFSIAPKYLPGAQIGLLSLLEPLLGPLWVFLIFDETPPFFTLLCGAVLVSTVAIHEFAGILADDHTKKPVSSSGGGHHSAANIVVAAPSSIELNSLPNDGSTDRLRPRDDAL